MELFGKAKGRPNRMTRTFYSDGTKMPPSPSPDILCRSILSLQSCRHSLIRFSGNLSLVRSVPLNFLISSSWECSVWCLFLTDFTGFSQSIEFPHICIRLKELFSKTPLVYGLWKALCEISLSNGTPTSCSGQNQIPFLLAAVEELVFFHPKFTVG